MFWLLGDAEDDEVTWLAAELRHAGERVEIADLGALTAGSRFSCRLGDDDTVSRVELADGRIVDDRTATLVVNRLDEPRPAFDGRDARYAAEEWRAALVAWLRMLRCPVLNPPRGATLAGPDLAPAMWRAIARTHGLACAGERADIDHEVLAVGRRCIARRGTVPEPVARIVGAMLAFVNAPLAALTFDASWRFVEITSRPSLSTWGVTAAALVRAHAAVVADEGTA